MKTVDKAKINETNQVKIKSCSLTYQANLDIIEMEKGVELLFDLPGIEKENVSIQVEKDQLSIRGTPNLAQAQPGDLIYQEYQPGNYARTVNLSADLDREKIEASFQEGVLRVFLPKREEAIPQAIAIH